jgi:hypothetical protein
MGKQYKELKDEHIEFIKNQKMFFVASCSDREVNLSPRGYDSMRILSHYRAVFLDYPGSGNRTASDISKDGEVTIMFCAFEGDAKILRMFCKGVVISKDMSKFDEYTKLFDEKREFIRQFIELHIYAVETSCGEGVPLMQYISNRDTLRDWVVSEYQDGTLNEYITNHSIPVALK